MSGTGRLNKDIYAKQSSKSGIVFHQGDVLYGKLRPYLQNWLLPTFDGLAVGDFWVLQPQNADSSFLYRLIQSRQFDEVANQSTGTKMPRADWKLVSKTVFSIPSNISEQAAIGTYFTALDSLITLHQRQHFLHSTPDISLSVRLIHPFYTSSWEQRKVQGVADRFDNLRIPVAANLRVHGTTPYYGANGIQDYVEGFTHDGEFVLVAEDGANDLKNYPVKCVNGRIWVNNHAHVLQGKAGIADNSFLAFAISQSDIESLLVGGGRAKLNAETLMSIEFRLPCLQEQYRIGEYLTQLNHLITLHQRKGKAAVFGCFLNCFSLEKSSAQSRTLELFGQISNQEIKYIIDGLSILGGKLRNFCVKLIILLGYTRINDIAKYHISRNTKCVHNVN